jgi:hypothetical protein
MIRLPWQERSDASRETDETGAAWEVYVTDPADYPDPKDWKTELLWPLGR